MFAPDNLMLGMVFDVGGYLRLSREDETDGQSESIENQKSFITKYVLEQNWNLVDFYIDDGYSGLNYNRPAFKQILNDIENKKINLVITKEFTCL